MTLPCASPNDHVREKPRAISALPFISVVVPVRNEEGFIERLLERILGQNYDPERFEVLVADGQSTDATRAIVSRMQRAAPNLRLLHNPQRWSSAGRNRAIEAACGELIAIVDGHCDLNNPNYLWEMAETFARTGADCVGRPQPLDVTGATSLQRAIAAARASPLGHHPDSFVYSATEQFVRPQSVAVAYRRAVFATVGLFDEGFDACEDVEFNHRVERAGFRCYFTPRVGLRYHPRSSLGGLFKQMSRYGQGRVRLLRKHSETFTVPGFLPALFVLGVLAGPLLAWISPWATFAYCGALAFYALAVALVSVGIALRKRDARLLPWLPLVFPTIHFGAGAGIVKEWIQGWGRRRTPPLPMPLPEQSQ